MADETPITTLGEAAYLAWWREYEHGHGYDHEAWMNLPQRHRNAWQAAAEAAGRGNEALVLAQITVSSRPDRPRVVATHPDDGTYWIKEVAFPEGQSVTLAEIIAEFEASNHLPRKG